MSIEKIQLALVIHQIPDNYNYFAFCPSGGSPNQPVKHLTETWQQDGGVLAPLADCKICPALDYCETVIYRSPVLTCKAPS